MTAAETVGQRPLVISDVAGGVATVTLDSRATATRCPRTCAPTCSPS